MWFWSQIEYLLGLVELLSLDMVLLSFVVVVGLAVIASAMLEMRSRYKQKKAEKRAYAIKTGRLLPYKEITVSDGVVTEKSYFV